MTLPNKIMQYGKAIRELRKAKGFKQQELAKLAGISQTYLSQIELGFKIPSDDVIKSVSKGIGIPKSALVLFALDTSDISPNKIEAYNLLIDPMKDLVLNEIQINTEL